VSHFDHSMGISRFTPGSFLKNCAKSNTKFPFKTVYILGVTRLTASSYIVCDYTTSGQTAL